MASMYSLGELILITPDLSPISIGQDTTASFEPQTITVAENKLTSTSGSFGNVEENIYVNSNETGGELLVKDGYKIKYVEYPKTAADGGTVYKPGTAFNSVRDSTKTTYISIEAVSSKVSIDLTTLTGWNDVTSGEHQISVVAKATGYRDSEKSTPITFTKQGGSSVSKNWKFNGTPAFVPQKTHDNHVTISGEAYNDTTFVEDFRYIYYADDWSYITFGSAGFWDISKNQYGKNAGNILKFNTEPSGELLAFLQAHAQPI